MKKSNAFRKNGNRGKSGDKLSRMALAGALTLRGRVRSRPL